jgi:tetratricopeptide (TPR) repeat protein
MLQYSNRNPQSGDDKMRRRGCFLFAATLTFIAAVNILGSLPTGAAVLAGSRSPCSSKNITSDEAIVACTAALKKNPRNAKLLIRRGVAWAEMGDHDYAIGDFSRAIRLNPRNALAYFYRGVAREKKGELEESLRDFRRYSELNPSDPEAQLAVERVMAALAPNPSLEQASANPANRFPNSVSADPESQSEATRPRLGAPSGAQDDFSLLISTSVLFASVALVAVGVRNRRFR